MLGDFPSEGQVAAVVTLHFLHLSDEGLQGHSQSHCAWILPAAAATCVPVAYHGNTGLSKSPLRKPPTGPREWGDTT
jgi:hypothetical protein